MTNCVCIGAAHIDSKLCCNNSAILETSNPVTSYTSCGGVARNVCENLAKQGVGTAMISRVGNDADGLLVDRHLSSLGVSTQGITRSKRYPTAKYTSVINDDGELLIGCADMNIYNELSPEIIASALSYYQAVPLWVLDMNLPIEAVETIAKKSKENTLWLLSVSIPKILAYKKNLDLLNHFEGLSLNRAELSALLGCNCQTIKSIEKGCFKLHELGINKLLVTMGKEGVLLCNGGVASHYPVNEHFEVVDTTGAGDAFIAGFLCGQIQQFPVDECISYGMKLAENVLSRVESVSNITE